MEISIAVSAFHRNAKESLSLKLRRPPPACAEGVLQLLQDSFFSHSGVTIYSIYRASRASVARDLSKKQGTIETGLEPAIAGFQPAAKPFSYS